MPLTGRDLALGDLTRRPGDGGDDDVTKAGGDAFEVEVKLLTTCERKAAGISLGTPSTNIYIKNKKMGHLI